MSRFYNGGSQFVVTATYQASVDGYKQRFSLDDAAAVDLIKQGVILAQRARDQHEQETGKQEMPLIHLIVKFEERLTSDCSVFHIFID